MPLPLVFHDDYSPPLPPGHRFPDGEVRLLRDHLVDSGLTTDAANLHPEPRAADILAQAHDRSYIEHCCIGDMSRDKLRRLALPVARDWRSAPCAQSA